MSAEWLLSWWNLVFVVPFLLALLYLGVYIASGLTFGDADADFGAEADADLDADVDADAHLEVGADADVGVDADADVDHEVALPSGGGGPGLIDAHAGGHADHSGAAHAPAGETGAHQPFHLAVMAALGVGRVPLSIILMVLLLTWGVIGFVANGLLEPAMGGARVALASLPLAAVGSLLVTRGVVGLLVRYLPTNQTFARRRHELLGFVGKALFPIDQRFGMAAVRDDRGDLFQVACRVDADRPPIPKGAAVKLVGYNAKHRAFFVIPNDPAGDTAATTTTTAAAGRH